MEGATRELEFVRVLGRGGFGTVYLANLHGRDQFVRPVAVKVLRFDGKDSALTARQRDEARLLGRLSHPGIVQVLDLAEVGGRPAVVMEYVEGADLGVVARAEGAGERTLPERAVLELVAQVASALDAAWASPSPVDGRPLRAIHRDLKPANLLLTPFGTVKVLDFGIARSDVEREGSTGTAFYGTVAYMAPEFWLQEAIGPAYDLYALGATALELATGRPAERPPLERSRYEAWLDARLGELPRADGPLAGLLREALAYPAASRPTAGELHERATAEAPGGEGESLARLARRVVPPLVEQGRRAGAAEPLPSPERVGAGVREAAPPPPGPAAGTSGATPPTESGDADPPVAQPLPGSTAPTLLHARPPGPPVPPGLVLAQPRVAPVAGRPGPAPRRRTRRGPLLLAALLGFLGLVIVGRWLAASLATPGETTVLPEPPGTAPAEAAATEVAAPEPGVGEEEAPPEAPTPVPAATVPAAPAPRVRPAPGPAPASPVEPAALEPAPIAAAPPPSPTRPPGETVPYTLATNPIGARVRVDGVDRGTSPLRDLALEPGDHLVELALDGRTASRRIEAGGARTGVLYDFDADRWTWLYE